MNTDLTDTIYKYLKAYLQAKSNYSPRVIKTSVQQYNKFPLVTIIEENNNLVQRSFPYNNIREIEDKYYWEINIYTTDSDGISKAQIADELKILVDDIMSIRFKLTRLSCSPTPNLDETIYRITMRYSCNALTNRKRIL